MSTITIRFNSLIKRFDDSALTPNVIPDPASLSAMKNLIQELETNFKRFYFVQFKQKKLHFLTIAAILLIYGGLFLTIWVHTFFLVLLIFAVILLLSMIVLSSCIIPAQIKNYEKTIQTVVNLHNDHGLLQVGVRGSFTFRVISHQVIFSLTFVMPSNAINQAAIPQQVQASLNNPGIGKSPLTFNIPIEAILIEDAEAFDISREENRVDLSLKSNNSLQNRSKEKDPPQKKLFAYDESGNLLGLIQNGKLVSLENKRNEEASENLGLSAQTIKSQMMPSALLNERHLLEQGEREKLTKEAQEKRDSRENDEEKKEESETADVVVNTGQLESKKAEKEIERGELIPKGEEMPVVGEEKQAKHPEEFHENHKKPRSNGEESKEQDAEIGQEDHKLKNNPSSYVLRKSLQNKLEKADADAISIEFD